MDFRYFNELLSPPGGVAFLRTNRKFAFLLFSAKFKTLTFIGHFHFMEKARESLNSGATGHSSWDGHPTRAMPSVSPWLIIFIYGKLN
jgi:hypothetical protein